MDIKIISKPREVNLTNGDYYNVGIELDTGAEIEITVPVSPDDKDSNARKQNIKQAFIKYWGVHGDKLKPTDTNDDLIGSIINVTELDK